MASGTLLKSEIISPAKNVNNVARTGYRELYPWSDDEDSSSTFSDGGSSSSSSVCSDSFLDRIHKTAVPKIFNLKTKGELDIFDLPKIEDLTITVSQRELLKVGHIKFIIEHQRHIVVKSLKVNEDTRPLDLDTVLFLGPNKPLGRIFDVFGQVIEPCYCVLFNKIADLHEKGIETGLDVFYAPKRDDITTYVFVDELRSQKGSDASWSNNNEPPEGCIDYSDDEQERAARQKRRAKGRACEDDEVHVLPKIAATGDPEPLPKNQDTLNKKSAPRNNRERPLIPRFNKFAQPEAPTHSKSSNRRPQAQTSRRFEAVPEKPKAAFRSITHQHRMPSPTQMPPPFNTPPTQMPPPFNTSPTQMPPPFNPPPVQLQQTVYRPNMFEAPPPITTMLSQFGSSPSVSPFISPCGPFGPQSPVACFTSVNPFELQSPMAFPPPSAQSPFGPQSPMVIPPPSAQSPFGPQSPMAFPPPSAQSLFGPQSPMVFGGQNPLGSQPTVVLRPPPMPSPVQIPHVQSPPHLAPTMQWGSQVAQPYTFGTLSTLGFPPPMSPGVMSPPLFVQHEPHRFGTWTINHQPPVASPPNHPLNLNVPPPSLQPLDVQLRNIQPLSIQLPHVQPLNIQLPHVQPLTVQVPLNACPLPNLWSGPPLTGVTLQQNSLGNPNLLNGFY